MYDCNPYPHCGPSGANETANSIVSSDLISYVPCSELLLPICIILGILA